ncbi:two component regulator propeller family protein (macronuclear) [Tetrahymena thermophila SB210]|uniref:Two component regulator propeller family protein n=1 Tax=Tetrahymena thermophila (strain SB210) TaxID=312017 RepID=Q23Q41_TETTS|nr:two component regulator propeller family protein [Tetrahymena thermophila SB210]EAR98743.2 two component regulator propeller family protein [Tetrahymena thermophila SB210]|eukprot:XP_001018988.2 two component regulator propeller family protein [Tetrahymena thermophila SB210]
MSYFQITAILCNIIFFVNAQELIQSQQTIFQALPKQVITINQNQTVVPTQMLIVEDSQLILFITQENYIALFDESKNKMKIIRTTEQVQSIMIFDNQQYLLAAMITYASVYQIQQDINKDQFLVERQTLSLDLKMISMVYLSITNYILFLSQDGIVIIFQYLGKGNISQKNKLLFDEFNFLSAQVTQDERFMFSSLSLKDIAIFQIEKNFNIDDTVEISNLAYLTSIQCDYWIVQLIILKNFIYYIDPWQGLYFADLSPLYQNNTQTIKNIKPTQFGLGSVNLSPTTYCMAISSDQKYLYLGVRSQGILIYDISNISNPIWYYQLFAQGQAYYLLISNKGQALYYSNSNGLYQYQQTKLSFTNNTPNMYNSHKSKSLFDGPPLYKWRCQILQKSNALFAAFDIDMIQRFQIIKNNQLKGDIYLQQIDTLPYAKDIITSTPYIETVCIDKNEDFLYIPITDESNIILKYQIPSSTNSSAPLQYIQSLQYNNVQFAESLKISQDNRYMVIAYSVGVMIVDIEKFEVLSLLTIQDMYSNCYGAEFTRDTNYIFATARNIGIWIINAKDKQNPFIIQVLKTKAAETVIASKLYDMMYCLDGFNGLLIFDTSALPKVVILSNLKLQGWVNDITLLSDENFGIISTMDAGMLSLVNLKDKSNPILISSYQIGQQNSQSTCVDPNMQYLLILNSQGIRYFPLDSDILIHHEFSIKQFDQNSKGRVVLSQEDFLLVGQTYELRLIPLYQQPNQLINNIFIYQNEQKQAIPSWINQINKLYLEIIIPKEAVSFSSNSIITLLVQTQFYLNNSSFILNSTSFVVSPSLSCKIYQYLKTCGFINSQDLVTDLYNPEVTLNFNDFGNDLTDPNQQIQVLRMARNILQNTIDYSPIQFKVQSSLNYILDQKNNSFQVHSISTYVSIQFSFSAASSLIFVQKEYPNVISYRDDQNTTLNIQSSVESINNILRGNILYHIIDCQNNDNINNQYQVNLLIQDGINSNINGKFNVSDLSFLKQKQNIKQLKELQSQIEKISSDSTFAIESTFFIQFDHNTFIDPDGIPLSYSLLIYQNNNYSSILPEYFLKFDEQNLRMTGTPQASNLFEIIRLRLVVSNGYNQLSSDFYIKIYNISLTYLLNLLLKYIGPVAFILGIYSQELAQINKIFRKKITLIENELIVAQAFLKEFQSKNRFKKKTIQIQKNYFGNQGDIASFEQIDPESFSFRPAFSSSNAFFSSQIQLNSTQIGFKKQNDASLCLLQISQMLKGSNNNQIKYISINKTIKKKKKLRKNKINTNQKVQKQYFKNLTLLFSRNTLSISKEKENLSEHEKKRIQFVKKSIQEAKINNFYDQDQIFKLCYSHPQIVNNLLSSTSLTHNLQYYNQIKLFNIKISADKLFSKMIQNDLKIKYQGNYLRIADFTKEYYNNHSRFNYCLNAKVVDYLLQLDIRTSIVYSYLKEYSQKYMNVTENDWYKAFVQIEPTNELDCHGMLIPFSNVSVNESSILNCLSNLDLYHSVDQPFDEIWQHGISPVLLKQALIFESLGLLNNNLNKRVINKSKDCKSGLIILEGIPTCSDHEEILIRIYNVKNYIIMQFNLKILHEQSQGPIAQQNIPLFQAQNQTEITRETPIKQVKNSLLTNLIPRFKKVQISLIKMLIFW